jgi:hypothetical protein
MASNDLNFEEKASDIVGRYLNPPQQAAIFLRRRENRDPGSGSQRYHVAAVAWAG